MTQIIPAKVSNDLLNRLPLKISIFKQVLLKSIKRLSSLFKKIYEFLRKKPNFIITLPLSSKYMMLGRLYSDFPLAEREGLLFYNMTVQAQKEQVALVLSISVLLIQMTENRKETVMAK